jgi:hypothetical protein
VIQQIRRMTPREAIGRVTVNEIDGRDAQVSRAFVAGSLLGLTLGLYKVASWIVGHSLLMPLLSGRVAAPYLQGLAVLEGLLNFVAVPLLLVGVIGVLRWRLTWFQYLLNSLTAPLVGGLRWFVAEHMALSRHRIASTMFLTALAMSMALLPQVAADTFYARILRGVQASVGGDIQLEFDLASLAGESDRAPVLVYDERVRSKLTAIEAALLGAEEVDGVAQMQQYIVPDVYLPTQSGLMLNVIQDPEKYRETVYYEEGLGLTRPFSALVDSFSGLPLTASRGFLEVRHVPLDSNVILGNADDGAAIDVQFRDVVAFLPGQPSIGVPEREGYASPEIDYLNYVVTSDARIITALERFERPPLKNLNVVPSRAVFLINTRKAMDDGQIAALLSRLPTPPDTVRSEAGERRKVSQDMFISLALENMKVFMIGGLVLAIAGVFVVGLANFIAERRTFSLLRLRGLPLPLLLRVSLSMFLVPVLVGIFLGTLLGAVSGYGVAQAIWELPRIYGVAGFLENRLVFSSSAWGIVFGFGAILTCVAVGFGRWPFRKTAREAIKEG